MDCFVYVLGSRSKGGLRTYVGWTVDLERRLAHHNAGTGAKSTRGRVWTLLYAERFATRREAMSREWHLKRDRSLRRRLAEALNTPDPFFMRGRAAKYSRPLFLHPFSLFSLAK